MDQLMQIRCSATLLGALDRAAKITGQRRSAMARELIATGLGRMKLWPPVADAPDAEKAP